MNKKANATRGGNLAANTKSLQENNNIFLAELKTIIIDAVICEYITPNLPTLIPY